MVLTFITTHQTRISPAHNLGSVATSNPIGDHLLLRFFKNKVDYCRIHGYAIFYNNVLLHPRKPSGYGGSAQMPRSPIWTLSCHYTAINTTISSFTAGRRGRADLPEEKLDELKHLNDEMLTNCTVKYDGVERDVKKTTH
ncbi:hypothetical protein LXL04_003579 [Taraxacum kok-saghyz]